MLEKSIVNTKFEILFQIYSIITQTHIELSKRRSVVAWLEFYLDIGKGSECLSVPHRMGLSLITPSHLSPPFLLKTSQPR